MRSFPVGLAGNPNVGKSTIFNDLTGLNQHTGNWPGKTVVNAQGEYVFNNSRFVLTDLPGTYSLAANSADEEAARDYICFENASAILVVCDATCLERNLNLAIQIIENTPNVVICVNLMDEAQKKGISINLKKLSNRLGVPIIGTNATSGNGIYELMTAVDEVCHGGGRASALCVIYPAPIEEALAKLEPIVADVLKDDQINSRWVSLKLIANDKAIHDPKINKVLYSNEVMRTVERFRRTLPRHMIEDGIVNSLLKTAEAMCEGVISYTKSDYDAFDRRLDRLLTGKVTGFIIMLALLALIFWITITGANYPSQLLADMLFKLEEPLNNLLAGFPDIVRIIIVTGGFRVLAWVISVMLPPMAIFFPLFTLLEDLGYLPRVAFNLDYFFAKCSACGKQALTMCMGFGCNAAAVIGCRIIDSPRERLIAIITNNFVPCNGRFPTLISIILMFFIGFGFPSIFGSFLLTLVVVLGIATTFAVSKLLSLTLLKGVPSSYTLEMPPYRKPQIGKIIVRSILDRTLFVLGRAIVAAIPAGIIIAILANITVDSISLLTYVTSFLDPFARLLGMDGVILGAFILGLPANEIVIPIMIMTYMSEGGLMEFESLLELRNLLVSNGWTWLTALNVILFSLMHWPCATTCFSIYNET
ncbi:MAG: ferrous iron transport protein B, partial [Clostridiales bacterium]|nr:ferrous iron transport protein B [Clostridiales bacterium]